MLYLDEVNNVLRRFPSYMQHEAQAKALSSFLHNCFSIKLLYILLNCIGLIQTSHKKQREAEVCWRAIIVILKVDKS